MSVLHVYVWVMCIYVCVHAHIRVLWMCIQVLGLSASYNLHLFRSASPHVFIHPLNFNPLGHLPGSSFQLLSGTGHYHRNLKPLHWYCPCLCLFHWLIFTQWKICFNTVDTHLKQAKLFKPFIISKMGRKQLIINMF